VNLTLARTVAGGVTIALAPDPASDLAVYPSQPVATVTATITGAPTSLVWSRIDANGGSNFLVGDAGGGDFEFRLPGTGSLAVTREQAWRLTDAGSGVFDDVTVELTRDV
jgi:hypothetical protein